MTDFKKDFIKALRNSPDRSLSEFEKFRLMLEMFYCSYAKMTAPNKERADALEARYMELVGRHRDPDTVRAYPELAAIAQVAVAGGGVDFLGDVAGELEFLDKGLEQFFTPYQVARFMAAATIDHDMVYQSIEEEGFFTLLEPACGAGVMVLAAADHLEKLGYDLQLSMLVQAVDLSPLCYYMTYCQLTWRGVSASVIHGNTLSRETFESAWTLPTHLFYQHHGCLFEGGSKAVTIQESLFV